MKIKVTDSKKWFIKFLGSFGLWILFSILVLLAGKAQEFIMVFAFISIVMVVYWIVSFHTTKCYMNVDEYLKNNPNISIDYLRGILSSQNFPESEINDIIHNFQEGKYSSNKIESENVKRILDEYKKYSIIQKIRFLAQFPMGISFEKSKVLKDEEAMEEVNHWIENNAITEKDFISLENNLILFHKDNDYELTNMIVHEIMDDLKLEYQLDEVNNIQYDLLSSSDKNLYEKLFPNHNMIFHKEKILFLQNNIPMDLNYFCDLKELCRKYVNGEYSYSNNVIYEIKYSDILCYATEGSKTVNSILSGGGMSGVIDPIKANIYKKSKDGFSLGGESGAIYSMLSDIKMEPIRTTLVENDERVLLLKTKKIDFIFRREYSEIDLYLTFVHYLPDKDIERKKVVSESSNLDEIKKLKELLDMGAITKEEYNKKKKELLK